ncbi:alanine racemase [Ornithinimicrobium cavernae]|uniref:alanine racemase n=1 Tax=Ornithinimicrobium cavernae TaxID=2666047 RepID=UPI000D692C64|nr:alanine racemase [Ornithinimicrobium cavernae]
MTSPTVSVPTPATVVDVEVLERNIRSVHEHLAGLGVRVRPHVKTHKSLEIARRQLAAGAAGLTVATVGEAEVFAEVCSDLFIAYPLWPDDSQLASLARLSEGARVAVGTDSEEAVHHLAKGLDRRVELMIEVDSGHHRSGCSPEQVARVARAAGDHGLTVRGVFTFPGHSYAPGEGGRAAREEADALRQAAELLRAELHLDRVEVSGGSTPSTPHTRPGVITETRPGVYVFNDAQQWELGTVPSDQIALTVHARVVSVRPGSVVLDSGSKVLGADRAAYATGFGRLLDHPEARIVQLSEHHAVVAVPPTIQLHHGDRVRVVPNHVCNAVNLVDQLIPVAGGRQLPPWPVDARGRNR